MIVLLFIAAAIPVGLGVLVANGIYWPLVALGVNYLVGAYVMASIDRDGRKLAWFKSCPDPTGVVQFLFLELWPIPLWLWWRDERGSRP